MKKGAKKVIKRLILSVFVIVLVVMLPMVDLKADNNIELIYRSFIGKKSDYLGFIEIWNIDTFESGGVSKYEMLQTVAKEYQKENKGTYVIVRNITESECKNMIAKGQKPDLFSCSYGVASEIKDYVVPFSESFDDLYENLLSAGKYQGCQYAVPWCYNNYYLFSTKSRVEAYFKDDEKISLSKIALETGSEKINKNKKEIIYSLGFGMSKYLMPQIAFSTYINKEIALKDYSLSKETVIKNSPYDAYCNFLVGGSNILLGTKRDLIRLCGREEQGKLEGLVVEKVSGFTDLLQFALITKNSEQRYNHAQAFVKKLVSAKVQEWAGEKGMFVVNKTIKSQNNTGIMSNITPENIENYKCFNVFLTKGDIERLQKSF